MFVKGVDEVASLGAGPRSNRSVCVENKRERESMIDSRIKWEMKATEGVPLCGAQWVLPAPVRTRGDFCCQKPRFSNIKRIDCQDEDDKAKQDFPMGVSLQLVSQNSSSPSSLDVTRNISSKPNCHGPVTGILTIIIIIIMRTNFFKVLPLLNATMFSTKVSIALE